MRQSRSLTQNAPHSVTANLRRGNRSKTPDQMRNHSGRDDQNRTYLHRGIAARDFEQRFQLANHVKVTTASFDNGMLNIELVREVPEALKPRKIAIDGGNVQVLEQRQAA